MGLKTLYFDNICGYITSATVENGRLSEFFIEKENDGPLVGNIYKGKVESVLTGMQAAFVNCGLEKNCFLPLIDKFDCSGYDGEDNQSETNLNLKVGDEICVQVIKPPVGNKGAKVTTRLEFVGKALIYLPDAPFCGVSRKIHDDELRKNLIYTSSKLIDEGEGVIVRTVAPHAKTEQLKFEIKYLKNLYKNVKKSFLTAKTGDLLYADVSLPARIMRDTLSCDVQQIIVGNKTLENALSDLVALYPPRSKKPLVLFENGRDMFDETGISKQIAELVSPRVELEKGAYLIIERTEALTVIDVNTGKFTGDDNLEQTVYQTNIIAAREIARQVKLRNIGGIVVVDFIDMQSSEHKKSVVEELEKALKTDKFKCQVSPMSKLGLVEFSRKRIGASPLNFLTKPCKHCRQEGVTKSFEYLIFCIRAKLLNLIAGGTSTVCVDMNFDLALKLLDWSEMIADIKSNAPQARIYIISHRTWNEEKVTYRIESSNFALPLGAVLMY